MDAKDRISIVSFNVENCFDTTHDEGKEDFTFMPLSKKKNNPEHLLYCKRFTREDWQRDCMYIDWNEEVLCVKLQNIADAIQCINYGVGPDVLIIQEIENKQLLDRLNRRYLAACNYQTVVMLDCNDYMGRNIGVLSRFPIIGKAKTFKIPFSEEVKDSRDFLEVTLDIGNGGKLHVFGLHLPAPYQDIKLRLESLQYLNKLMMQVPEDRIVIAAGDSNVSELEDKETDILKKSLGPFWHISHKVKKPKNAEGTIYFEPKKSWTYMDIILVSKSAKGWEVDPESIAVENYHEKQIGDGGTPYTFDWKEKKGVSDHFPIRLDIVKTK